ncbi:DUF1206 domain-containing protein [Microbacterium sp. cx-55]|uniref:DUF1206 domain-containing protein n=1 Tax=Microbacterium sp. cx-55 TaxID=2875948 RepID=UPI001CBBA5E7|nr:DUF1206 domain-containing protein [Microbacterium sp. cx-55]MBZ4488548.1 DUF1206 domain-containing protein [Microbacterium sp. cx-55]UGB36131.1 DUF1206 domain-containing protein [Microbacterium sp. cx-55]
MTVAKDAARAATDSTAFRALARTGYAANGVVHALIGVIVVAIAAGGDGESDQAGAFKAIADAPAGFLALWVLAVALGALGVWHVAGAVIAQGSGDTRRWVARLPEAGRAAVYLALAAVSVTVALGSRPDSESSAQSASGGVLSLPGGPFLLGAAGLAIGGAGVAFVVIGIRRSFRKKLALPAGPAGRSIMMLGSIGYAAKGVALAAVGVLLVVAAVRVSPEEAGGLDGAISALRELPFGPWIIAGVGVGFIAYGIFCGFRARFARL